MFPIRIRASRRPAVTVEKRRAPVRRGGRRAWSATVDLRGLPKQRAVVRIKAGKRRLPSRIYRTCVARDRG